MINISASNLAVGTNRIYASFTINVPSVDITTVIRYQCDAVIDGETRTIMGPPVYIHRRTGVGSSTVQQFYFDFNLTRSISQGARTGLDNMASAMGASTISNYKVLVRAEEANTGEFATTLANYTYSSNSYAVACPLSSVPVPSETSLTINVPTTYTYNVNVTCSLGMYILETTQYGAGAYSYVTSDILWVDYHDPISTQTQLPLTITQSKLNAAYIDIMEYATQVNAIDVYDGLFLTVRVSNTSTDQCIRLIDVSGKFMTHRCVNRWDGTDWQKCTVKRWDGTDWDYLVPKRWDGTDWVNINAD